MNILAGLDWTVVGIASAVAILAAFAGGFATRLDDWYEALRKPPWQPPPWLFGPVWTTIFVLAVLAFAISWRDGEALRGWLVAVFAVNTLFNIAWSVLFFTLRRPDWAFFELILLWISILAMIVVAASIGWVGAALLAPYLVWVTIAGVLNRTIVRLNAPFAGRPHG